MGKGTGKEKGGESMNEIMNIGGVDCYEKDGTAYLKLEAVARGLGFTQIAKSGNAVSYTHLAKNIRRNCRQRNHW